MSLRVSLPGETRRYVGVIEIIFMTICFEDECEWRDTKLDEFVAITKIKTELSTEVP